jgi:hypothetical protein
VRTPEEALAAHAPPPESVSAPPEPGRAAPARVAP